MNCDIFHTQRWNFTLPDCMFFTEVDCSNSVSVRYLLDFKGNGLRSNLDPYSTLVAEGKWDGDKKRLDMVGCRILDGNGTVGDCSIRLSLRLPMLYTIRERNLIVGEIWSSRRPNETGYFGRVKFSRRV